MTLVKNGRSGAAFVTPLSIRAFRDGMSLDLHSDGSATLNGEYFGKGTAQAKALWLCASPIVPTGEKFVETKPAKIVAIDHENRIVTFE